MGASNNQTTLDLRKMIRQELAKMQSANGQDGQSSDSSSKAKNSGSDEALSRSQVQRMIVKALSGQNSSHSHHPDDDSDATSAAHEVSRAEVQEMIQTELKAQSGSSSTEKSQDGSAKSSSEDPSQKTTQSATKAEVKNGLWSVPQGPTSET